MFRQKYCRKKKKRKLAADNMIRLLKLFVIVLLIFHFTPANAAQLNNSEVFGDSGGLWNNATERSILGPGERLLVPESYSIVVLDPAVLNVLMSNASTERSAAAQRSSVVMSFPMPDGTLGRFKIEESPVMAPELAAKFPEIKTYSGQGLDEPTSTVRFDWTPQGFHAMIMSTTGRIFIDPYSRNNTTRYISYYTRDYLPRSAAGFFEHPPVDPGGARSRELRSLNSGRIERSSGTQLRTYRLAVAATGEYTAYHGGTVNLGLAAIVTAVNRVTGIYEKEVAVRLQLVANNNLLVYTNSATDPYTNNDGEAMLDENQSTLDDVIGNANYDLGHVFSTGGGGIAAVGVPCISALKAQGVTGSSAPNGDAFWVDYVAHEMGHQFGAFHTFNSTAGSCGGGNRDSLAAYESGSGSTIMAYAGICGSDNLQAHTDAYFHTVSFDEIVTYTTVGLGNSCPTITATGNNPPVPSAGTGGFYIPANTPFILTGSADDPDDDNSLTYNWEEYDLGTAGPPGNNLKPPFFRSWPATSSASRIFPRLSDLLNNTTALGEVLPNITRGLTFRMTVRDNKANGGGVNYATLRFNVTTAAGPFRVTSPNTAVTWTVNSSHTVTWNVANTTASPVSCPNVGILLSTDGGLTFPTTLSASSPNDGSKTVTVPNTPSAMARVKVYCTNNIFFDLSDINFTILADVTTPTCTYAISPKSQTFSSAGGTGNVTVTASSSSCKWTATSSLSWTNMTADGGTGSGTATFSVSANTETDRTGNITIAGQTFVITQAGSESAATTNLILNPGFESGNVNWTEYALAATPLILKNFVFAHTGSWYAWLGGVYSASNHIYQDVTIPSETQLPYLQFWYRIATSETTTLYAYDNMAVEIRKPDDNTLLATLAVLSNLNETSDLWVQSRQYDLSAYRGQTIRLIFTAITDSSNNTNFRVDDVSLNSINNSCTYAISPTSQAFSSAGGTGDVTVTASASSCTWSATSYISWAKITAGSGTGSGTATFSLSPNTETYRTGNITIAGQAVTITQSGYADNNCVATLSDSFLLHVPYFIMNGSSLWLDFQYVQDLQFPSTDIMFKLVKAEGLTIPSDYSNCIASELSVMGTNYVMRIPILILGEASYWLDLTYVPTSDGLLWFKLTDYGAN